MIEQSDVAHYLLSLGVVKPRDVVEGDFAIVDVSRRHCVFLVTTRSGPAFVVKQATPANASFLAHEASVLRRLGGAGELGAHVPTVVHDQDGCLVLRTPAYARDWADHRGRFPRVPARSLGRVLAQLHGLRIDLPQAARPIWGLLLPEPPHELVVDLSAGAQDVVARIQASPAVCERLEALRDADSDRTLIHGDLRWENCLALPAPGSKRRTRVLLVDWELADHADPAFDVGSVLAEYLTVWVGSIPIVDPAAPGRLVNRALHPLRRMQPAMHAFWAAYSGTSADAPPLRRVVELAGVRLLQTAIERSRGLWRPSAHVVTLIQLADNLLRRPDDAALDLLGLRA
jgi:aminoglycoside phosphotransferase (APT) family kinase protein